jgi:lipopolysaccharide export system permease protein
VLADPQARPGHNMKTLHLYLTRQVLTTLLMTVSVFTFVLMLGSVLKEILGLLVSRQVGFEVLLEAIALLIPFVLVFALPMGMLTAALLVFGRFSADQELTAARAGGISLIALITPVLLLSVALSCVAAFINLHLAPRCRVAYNDLLRRTAMSRLGAFIPEKTYIKDFTNSIVYVGKVRGTNLQDVFIYTLNADQVESYLHAETGTYHFEPTNNVIDVWLKQCYRVSLEGSRRLPRSETGDEATFSYTNVPQRVSSKINLSDRTFLELQEELRDLEARLGAPLAVGRMASEEMRLKMRQFVAQKRADITMPVRVQMHRQVSLSFACIGFTLIGIPLGIRAHRRETTFGIAMALILVLIYYSFFIVGQALETKPELSPHLILWLPNFIFQAVGIVLLWRANRGV